MSGHNQFELLRERRFLPFFLTQSLGAFNDNVFKNGVVVLIMEVLVYLTTEQKNFYYSLVAALFILPFFLFSATAGQLSDKLDKARIARWVKLLEIAIMAVASLGFITKNLSLLLAMVFMMGTHSAIFGPLKYGILPQILRNEELVGGNGLVEMGTFLSILLGTILGSVLIQLGPSGVYWIAFSTMALAVLGYCTARQIPAVEAIDANAKLNWNLFSETWNNLAHIRDNRTVFLSCLGISWFWFFGSVYLTQMPAYAEQVLGGKGSLFTFLLAVFSIGIAIGSLLCEKLSGHKVEIGLVPFGAIGMTLFGVDLYFAQPNASGASEVALAQFLSQWRHWRIVLDLFGIAMFAGFFIVPLFALVQSRSDPARRSRVIAANNILNALFMVVAAVLSIVVLNQFKFSIPQLLLFTAILNAVVALYIFTLVPEFLMRFLSWILINTLYRLEVKGIDNVPEEGPALVVCNHVSFMDALIVGGTVRRPIRFVMDHNIFKIPFLNFMFRTAKAIPIAPRKVDEAMLLRAFAEVDKALAEGEVVGIFPEGKITHTGEMNPFKAGVEEILKRRPVPVIPMALRGMWGSMFSRKSSLLGKHILPRRLLSRVALVIDPPVPPEHATAPVLEQRVRALRGDWA